MSITTQNRWKMGVAGFALAALCGSANAQMAIPKDVKPTCVADLDKWFADGTPTKNGLVNPADSLTFTTDNSGNGGPDLCNFYQWGAQMFLWLTSPNADGQPVFDSQSFFNVSPEDSNGNRTLIPNTGSAAKFALRAAKQDDGQEEIGEVGQAGGSGVLMSQQKSLVYYGIHVNEVYGYFLTGQKDGGLPNATTFPRNQADLAAIQAYVKTAFPDISLDDPDTLTIELKTSWVDAQTVSDPGQYLVIDAEVPAFDMAADVWTLKPDPEPMQLALVGMHVVGTVQDHPEFIWATFEHVSNAPDAGYSYTNTAGQVVEQSYSSAGEFLFMASGGSEADANVECMSVDKSGNIVANSTPVEAPAPNCEGGIVPSNTVRTNPWGSSAATQSGAVIDNNTLLLSINNSVIGQLSEGDVRKNYVQVGGLWTTTSSDAPIPNQVLHSQRGSLNLANATMETYHQQGKSALNCFDCHQLAASAKNSFEAFGLSHIYSQISPLAVPKSVTAKCTAEGGSLQFLKNVTCQNAQAVAETSPPCGGQNYQPFKVGNEVWETQDQCSGEQQPYTTPNNEQSFMWYSCSRYPDDC